MAQTDQQPALHVPASQVSRRILRATGALMIIQVIMRLFGLIEKIILGKYFGTAWTADAYMAARDIAFYVFQLVDQVVMHSFLPVFVQRMRDHGEKDAWRLASTAINILVLVMAAVAALGIAYAPAALAIFVPDWFSGNAAQAPGLVPLTITLTRVMLVAVIFLATSSLTYSLLNSYKQFALPASADLALKGTVLAFAVIFAGSWGPVALAVGFVIGAVAKVAVHAGGLGRRLIHYRPVLDGRHPGLARFGLLALPLIVGVTFSIFRQWMDMRFTSSLTEGSLSALKYAKTLCDVPVQFFPYAFGIALFPFLADIAVAGDRDRLRGMLMSATRMMVLIFVPLAVAVITLRYPIILGIYGSARFDMASAHLTAAPLQLYAVGMLVGALEIIVLQFFFAMSDTLRPTIVGAVMVPLHIAVAYVGVYHFGLGAAAIALALLVSKSSKILLLYGIMRRRLGALEGSRTALVIGKMAVALVPFVALLLAAAHYLPHLLPPPAEVDSIPAKLLALLPYLFAGGVAMIVYFAALWALRVGEVALLLERVRGKLRKSAVAAGPPEGPSVEP